MNSPIRPAFFKIVLFIAVLLFSGCSSSSGSYVKAYLGQELILPVGQTADINNGELFIKFEAVIADSRCPTGVQCVWAGEAKCQMQVTRGGTTTPIVFTAAGGTEGYSKEIIDSYVADFRLDPYPRAGQEINKEDYRLILKITKTGT